MITKTELIQKNEKRILHQVKNKYTEGNLFYKIFYSLLLNVLYGEYTHVYVFIYTYIFERGLPLLILTIEG